MLESTLQNHINVCEQIYALILEENRLLKQSGNELAETMLEQKRALLVLLEESLENLRDANASLTPRTPNQSALIDKAQQMILKTLLLDRENEQLLLRKAMPSTPSVRPTAGHLQRIYGKYSS